MILVDSNRGVFSLVGLDRVQQQNYREIFTRKSNVFASSRAAFGRLVRGAREKRRRGGRRVVVRRARRSAAVSWSRAVEATGVAAATAGVVGGTARLGGSG
jgi:hypothetical protein